MSRFLTVLLLLATIPVFAAPGEVRVITDPEGAEVWLNGILLGRTTGTGLLLDAQPGPVTYSIRKRGYVDVERSVQVGTGSETLTVTVVMTPLARSDSNESPKRRSHTSAIVLGVGGALAAGAAAVVLTKKDPLEIDDDRDGFTEKQGDCNDADGEVRPGGEFSITVSPDLVGTVSCNSGFQPIQVSATNLSCTTVTVSSISLTIQPIDGGCFTRSPIQNIPVSSGSVVPGSRGQVVAVRQFGGVAGCCTGGSCGSGFACSFGETYTVTTTAGQRAASFTFRIEFPGGRSCVACQSGAAGPVELLVPPSQ